ncbi:MAG: hypothetical protein DWQ31_00940 [Planctomycetota bacterium]|nr:MAG: hypothetical protein DWQ31_00940 [Planctomycetota bacterium]REJ92685.1 MAG: hypothetical protein DWQ35_11625 [Planctomycetota bacterium]
MTGRPASAPLARVADSPLGFDRLTKKSAICLVVDGLHAGFLGALGNSWVRTPTFDRLASQSLLLDTAIVDRADLGHLGSAYWQGRHALVDDDAGSTSTPLAAQLSELDVSSILLTDDRQVAEHPAATFAESIVLPVEAASDAAADLDQTQLARFFAAAIEVVEQASQPALVWLHTRGLFLPWDAPLAMREEYRDEEDPDALATSAVPDRTLSADHDPDELVQIVHAYAAQVAVLDACLGMFLESLDRGPFAETAMVNVLGARGFPLGEHLVVGGQQELVYGESLQVPWMLRLPDRTAAATRTTALVQPADLFATLVDWFELPEQAAPTLLSDSLLKLCAVDPTWNRDRACSLGSQDQWSIRTDAWFLRGEQRPQGESRPQVAGELFVKPDDRFEQNEVAARCGEIVELLTAAFAEFQQFASGAPDAPRGDLPALDARLTGDRF